MCGIAGYVGPNLPAERMVNSTLNLMRNRGPDHQASKDFILAGGHALLLHSRLSIIDLDPRANQPFTMGSATIVFNGEIYNYVELRNELEADGVRLVTNSDTEVLLHYYIRYGEDCVHRFEGMWSFGILDQSSSKLFLSRDRFAEKPLYYMMQGRDFFFASEIKFLRQLSGVNLKVNERHLKRNLIHGYKSIFKTDETFFEGVDQLGYGQNLVLSESMVPRLHQYWKPKIQVDENMSLEEAVYGTREKLFESIRIRLRADVPVAFCLSGGVDSASLVSIAAKRFNSNLQTFSIIDSDDRYNEEENILATVRDVGCQHHLIPVSQKDSLERLYKLIEYHDAPVATISYLIHSMISEAVHKGGFRVAFSGTAADELFTGYYDHFILQLNEVRDRNDYQDYLQAWENNVGRFIRNPILRNPNLYKDDPEYRDHIFDGKGELKSFLIEEFSETYSEENFTENFLKNRMANELFHEIVPVILHEDDLNSMFYSVENRSPFLDTQLYEFAHSIPARHLIKDGYSKYVLRESVKGILNDKVRLDRRKKGFNASINSIVNLGDPDVRSYLLESSSDIFNIIKRDRMEKLFDLFPIPNHLSKFIFNFINAKMFLDLN